MMVGQSRLEKKKKVSVSVIKTVRLMLTVYFHVLTYLQNLDILRFVFISFPLTSSSSEIPVSAADSRWQNSATMP